MSQKFEENRSRIEDLVRKWLAEGKRHVHFCPEWDFTQSRLNSRLASVALTPYHDFSETVARGGALGMLDVLVIIPRCGLTKWRHDNSERIASIQLGTQTGRFDDGKKFRYTVADGDWLERLRGIRFREYKIEQGCNLTTREIASLQAMMQI